MTTNPDTAEAPRAPEAAAQRNFERLLSKLADGTLAAQLVAAYAAPGDVTPREAANRVLQSRLAELKQSHDQPKG